MTLDIIESTRVVREWLPVTVCESADTRNRIRARIAPKSVRAFLLRGVE